MTVSLGHSRHRLFLPEALVRPSLVVIEEVAAQTTTEVSLVEDNNVVEQFAAEGANDAFGERVLPGRARRSENLGHAHALHSSPELATVDAVAIGQ